MSSYEEFVAGADPLPFRRYAGDPVLHAKQTDGPEAQPRTYMDVDVRVFDLAKEADLKAYNEAMMEVGQRQWQLSQERIEFSQQTGGYVVFLRRVRPYKRNPPVQTKEKHEQSFVIR